MGIPITPGIPNCCFFDREIRLTRLFKSDRLRFIIIMKLCIRLILKNMGYKYTKHEKYNNYLVG